MLRQPYVGPKCLLVSYTLALQPASSTVEVPYAAVATRRSSPRLR